MLPDSVRNYLTKFVDDRWMPEPEWGVGTVADVLRALQPRHVITLDIAARLAEVVTLFKERGISQIPVTDRGRLAGILTEADVLHVLLDLHATRDTALAEVMHRQVSTEYMTHRPVVA